MLERRNRPVTTRPDAAVAASIRPNRARAAPDDPLGARRIAEVATAADRLDRGAGFGQLAQELVAGVAEHQVVAPGCQQAGQVRADVEPGVGDERYSSGVCAHKGPLNRSDIGRVELGAPSLCSRAAGPTRELGPWVRESAWLVHDQSPSWRAMPPSTRMQVPVIHAEASLAKNSAAPRKSSA